MQALLKKPLESPRLRIRKFNARDITPFVEFMTDKESTKYLSFDIEQKSESGAAALLEATIKSYNSTNPMLAFAVEQINTNVFVGFCGLNPYNKEDAEIMYAVMPSQRNKGYATEIASTLAKYALQGLGYSRVIAPITPANKHSRHVAESAGFKDRGLIQHKDYLEEVHNYVFESQV